MPDNVKIAIKVEKGKIHQSGEIIDGWNVFKTSGGKITDEVLYLPPQCEEAQEDKISFAQVCDYHDGQESVGKEQFTRIIPNKQCFDATMTLVGTLKIDKRETHDTISWDKYEEYRIYNKDVQVGVTMSLKMTNSIDMIPLDEYWEYYKSVSRSISSFYATSLDHRYEFGMTNNGYGFKTEQKILGDGYNQRFSTPMIADVIIVAYDKKTKKAKRLVTSGASIAYKHRVQDNLYTEQYNPKEGVKKNGSSISSVGKRPSRKTKLMYRYCREVASNIGQD